MSRFRRRAIPCKEFVELVTDYLEGTLDPSAVRRIDRHLGKCAGCARVLAQWREVVHLAGRIEETHLEVLRPDVREDLMEAFRTAQA
jgi:anti-sigma factor RsiW